MEQDIINIKNEHVNVRDFLSKNKNNASNIVEFLDKLGRLPQDFDLSWATNLLNHPVVEVRIQTIKAIGKVHSEDTLDVLKTVIKNDTSTLVIREAVSSIGRIKKQSIIPVLIELLEHKDPKIVCQALRGLIVFRGIEIVDSALKKLKKHPNEVVRKGIETIFSKQKSPKYSKINSLNHINVLDCLKNVAVNGDVLEVLKYVPDDSIHLTFTSPPYYNARDYSIYESYDAYLSFLEKVFTEVHRVTKEGRFFILNTSPVIVPRISRAHASKRYPISFDLNTILQKLGWEFIDDIIWMKPEYSVKNRVGGFMQHRKPLGYKPNSVTEYLMVYRKSTNRLIDWNMRQYTSQIIEDSKVDEPFETTNVWQISPKSDKVHSAIFPEALCDRVVRYYSYKGDLVFDPFGGSGTLAKVAKILGRHFFITEMDPTYFAYLKNNIAGILQSVNDEDHYLTLNEFKNTLK